MGAQSHFLGSITKIIAKTLGRRIQEFLAFVIRPNQTGFVEGRNILDNDFLAEEALFRSPSYTYYLATTSRKDAGWRLFDRQKAFVGTGCLIA
jgi:hypothetical protein